MPAPAKLPVLVVTGFLGSGKTTLINQLLKHWPDSALVINEFGSTPVDQQLIENQGIPLTVLAGGCLCCQVRGALTPTLKNLWMAWQQGRPLKFQRVIIETSGVASPEPVLDTLLRERWLASRYHLQGLVATLAVPDAAEQLDRFAEARSQVVWADRLVLTQADLARPGQMAALTEKLARLAPATPRVHASYGQLDPAELLDIPRLRQPLFHQPETPAHQFQSLSFCLDKPVVWAKLDMALQDLWQRHPSDLVRVKGVVYSAGETEAIIVQGAAGRLYPATRLPLNDDGEKQSRLVFITLGLSNELKTDIAQALATATEGVELAN